MFDFKRNYFELLGMSQSFVIDLDELQTNYWQILTKIHPDKLVNETDQQKRLALQYSALVNEAYKTLKQPATRAVYLLSLQGIEVNLETNTSMPAEFLMKQMELREGITQAVNDSEKLAVLKKDIIQQRQQLINELEIIFTAEQPDLEQAKQLTLQLTFFDRLLAEVKTLS